MTPVDYALAVLALGLLVAVLVLAQRVSRVEQRLRAQEAATRDLEPVRKRERARLARKRAEEERQAARH